MKKWATLLLVMISLVITPVITGQCNHALAGDAQAMKGAPDGSKSAKFSKDDTQQSNKQPSGGVAHFHCCCHMSAVQPNPSADVAFNSMPHRLVVGIWKAARYNSRNVSPLLEPPSHA